MRIFLLPISTRQALVYCQRTAKAPGAKISIADRITQKAAETWAKWEAADGGWQKKVVEYGNRGLQRIPYQEWGLKSFPASNPTLQAEQLTEGKKYDVVYPGNIMAREDVPKVLARLAHDRKQLHYRRFIGSMIAIPFMLPFALIPIIPNIPGFYMAYRSWSHWKALKGSDHLDFILDHKLFKLIPDNRLEDIYSRLHPQQSPKFDFITRSQLEAGEAPTEKLLLEAGSHEIVSKKLEVPELSTEVERAVWQVRRALEKEKTAQHRQHAEEPNISSSSAPQEKQKDG